MIINGGSERTFQNNTNNCTGAKFLPQNLLIGYQRMKKVILGRDPPMAPKATPCRQRRFTHGKITRKKWMLSLVMINNTTSQEWPVVFVV